MNMNTSSSSAPSAAQEPIPILSTQSPSFPPSFRLPSTDATMLALATSPSTSAPPTRTSTPPVSITVPRLSTPQPTRILTETTASSTTSSRQGTTGTHTGATDTSTTTSIIPAPVAPNVIPRPHIVTVPITASAPSPADLAQNRRQLARQEFARQVAAIRPWWRPPPRNFRPHPGNNTITSYSPTTTLAVAPGSSSPSGSIQRVEPLWHYGWRSFNYVLRIPFRELIGNILRGYDPTAPIPLPDVPLYSTIIDTRTNQRFPASIATAPSSIRGVAPSATTTTSTNQQQDLQRPSDTMMTGSWDYLPQIRKAWADRTPNMSWPLSTAFFTSVLATVLAITALILNWEVQCTYLKVFLIVFVARKWIITVLMFDRALYRLPLGLTEPDPDIDEERHNGIAIYLTRLFTWHGYAMFFFGSCYVFVYGFSRYLSSAPVIVGVAMTFACMGLTPFFALLLLVFLTMALLYFLYLVLMCMIWPCERCGLTRRRAISRRNGGYQSSGTTNTTDLRQVAQALEDGEAGQRSGGGFGTVDSLKITPAMAAIPIVIFRKPKKVADSKTVPSSPSSTTTSNGAGVSGGRDEKDPAMAVSTHMNTLPVVVLRSNRLDSGAATPQRTPSRPTTVLIASLTPGQTSTDRLDGGSSGVRDQSSSSSSSSSSTGSLQSRRASRVLGELPVTIDIPPVPALINNSDNDSQNDAINRMPISMSALCNYTSTSGGGIAGYDQNRTNAARSRSASLTLDTVITIPPPLPAVPTSASLSTNLTTSGIGSVANTPAMSSVPIPFNQSARPLSQASSIASFIPCASAHEMDESEHRRSAYLQPTPIPNPVSAAGALTNTTTSVITNAAIASSGLNVLNHLDRAYLRANTPLTGVKSSTSASSQQQTQASVLSAASITATVSTGTPSIEEEDENYPVITDEECAICLFDFEHGDQLRHLPCDHFFHQTCVDRWLVKNAFCPKCKRGI